MTSPAPAPYPKWNGIRTWFRRLLSGKDNMSPDVARVQGFLSLNVILAMGITEMVRNEMHPIEFAWACSIVIAASAGAVWVKKGAEPDPPPAPPPEE